MGQLSALLRNVQGGGLKFWCPGCNDSHQVTTGPGGWQWNNDVDRPTFSPSVLVQGTKMTAAGEAAYKAWDAAGFPERGGPFDHVKTVCHSFVRDGQIQFLGDCTHELAGQTVPLPAWPPGPGVDIDAVHRNQP